jgi:PBSX family phage terminase large subunit
MLDLDQLPMSPKQIISIARSTARVNIWHGSIRSGKTIASLVAWLIFIATAPRSGALVMVGRTRDTVHRNLFVPLMDPEIFGEISKYCHYTPGAPTGTILGRTIHVFGASDAKSEPTIRGMTVAGAYCDEVTVLIRALFMQLLGRMSIKGAKLFGTTNPDNPNHWLKIEFLDRAQDIGWKVWHFVIDDNKSLDPEYVAAIKSEYHGLWYKRFIMGLWVAAEGAIYPEFDPDIHVKPWASMPDMQRVLGIGMDDGTTNAAVCLMLGLGVDNRLWLMDEWRHDPAIALDRLTDAKKSEQIRKWLATQHHPRQDLPYEWFAVDPAAASIRVQLHEDHVRAVTAANNNVKYGIGLMSSLIGCHKLMVTDRCKGFITEAPGYSWDPKATQNGIDAPIKEADHSMDTARYIVASTHPIWRNYIKELAHVAC